MSWNYFKIRSHFIFMRFKSLFCELLSTITNVTFDWLFSYMNRWDMSINVAVFQNSKSHKYCIEPIQYVCSCPYFSHKFDIWIVFFFMNRWSMSIHVLLLRTDKVTNSITIFNIVFPSWKCLLPSNLKFPKLPYTYTHFVKL